MVRKKTKSLIPNERIEQSILLLRGQRVILDADLALPYGVTTARLNQQVQRNIDRFPEDFAFLLTKERGTGNGRQTTGRFFPPLRPHDHNSPLVD